MRLLQEPTVYRAATAQENFVLANSSDGRLPRTIEFAGKSRSYSARICKCLVARIVGGVGDLTRNCLSRAYLKSGRGSGNELDVMGQMLTRLASALRKNDYSLPTTNTDPYRTTTVRGSALQIRYPYTGP